MAAVPAVVAEQRHFIGTASRLQPRELLVHDRRVELGEDRRRLGHRRADRDRLPRPRGRRRVVAGDDRVGPPPSRSSTSSMRGIGAISPFPPSARSTSLAENGRNGESTRLRSATHCAVTWRIVPRRAGSSLIFHGSESETYLLTSATARIASSMPCFIRCASDQVTNGAERRLAGRQHRLVLRRGHPQRRDLAEVLVDQGGGPVDQVAPARRPARRWSAVRTPPR